MILELFSIHHKFFIANLSAQDIRLTQHIEQLQRMGTSLDSYLAIAILITSVEVKYLMPMTDSIKPFFEDSFKWENAEKSLIGKT